MGRGLKVPILIDYIHVAGYLGKAATALHPGDPTAAGTWADGQLLRVLHGRAKAVAATLRSVAARTRTQPRTRHLDSVAVAISGRVAVLDTSQIRLPGQTAFEPCDIVTDDGRLVFGKLKGRSSHLNHLGPQAVTAVAALREARVRTAFLERVGEAIAKQTADDIPVRTRIADAAIERMDRFGLRMPQALTVCLLIVGTWKGTPDVRDLPLLARVGLRSAIRGLERLGCQVELALVGTAPAKTPSPGSGTSRPSARTVPVLDTRSRANGSWGRQSR